MTSTLRNERWKRWLLFLMGGGINTAFTYVVYLALHTTIPYQAAYLIAYALGIIFAYCFNALFVFRAGLSWKGAFSYPLVYVIQYVFSAFFLSGLVEFANIDKALAPLIVTVAMIPLTYAMSQFILKRTKRQKQ